jgi:hypothetical protein
MSDQDLRTVDRSRLAIYKRYPFSTLLVYIIEPVDNDYLGRKELFRVRKVNDPDQASQEYPNLLMRAEMIDLLV